VLRFVSLGPESAVRPLIEARRGEKEKQDQGLDLNCDGNCSSNGNRDGAGAVKCKDAGISRGNGTDSRWECPIDANSLEDPSFISSCSMRGANSGSSISGSSTRVPRIISVEQKMQRTATQKLQAERLVLAHGLFDMGTSLSAVKEKEKVQPKEDTIGVKRSSDSSAVEDLFNENENENENGIHDTSPRSDLPPCPEGTSEGHTSTFVYFPGDLIDEESACKWFTDVCDRGRGRGSRSNSPLEPLKPLLPTGIGAVSSSSTLSSDCTSTSISTCRDPPVSYPILSGVFESSLMALYSTPREIVDWSEWLRTLSVGGSDRDDIDACVKSMLCSGKGSVGSGFNYAGSSSSSNSSSSSLSGRRRKTGLLSEDALWKQVQ
jgi:hypothetical protein